MGCGYSDYSRPSIDVIKRGEVLVNRCGDCQDVTSQSWGYSCAIDVCDDTLWFAAPVALDNDVQYGSWIGTERL